MTDYENLCTVIARLEEDGNRKVRVSIDGSEPDCVITGIGTDEHDNPVIKVGSPDYSS